MTLATRNGRWIDAADLKARARGRWTTEILPDVCGIDSQLLDGRHHPCPKCDGTDRFRAIDIDSGALFCNQCFSKRNGDGLAAVMWARGCDFTEACEVVADYLRIQPTNGHAKPMNGSSERQRNDARKFSKWQDAVADTESRLGKRAAEWPYHDNAGREVGIVGRWETDDGKTIRPFVEQADGSWACGAMPDPRPLYRLPEILASTGTIVVCEGEPATDACRQMGFVATTSSGGAQAAKKTDWSPLAGREVAIWPDPDPAGDKYKSDVMAQLETLEPLPTVRILEPAEMGLQEGEDAVDWRDRHDAQTDDELREHLEAIIAAAPVVLQPAASDRPQVMSLGELVDAYPELKPELIEGFLRRCEVANIIAKSKRGKSWLVYGLALTVAVGGRLFGRYPCHPGRVLIVDNELHRETLAFRLRTVAEAMGLHPEEFRNQVDVLPLRGHLTSLEGLGTLLRGVAKGHYDLIVLDALYRMLEAGVSENDNATMTALYNALDRLAEQTGAAFVCIHHASKGDQSNKDVTDVGSGAGSQSRAADTHVILRPHEEEDAVVLDAALRSFAPVQPVVLRWEFPLWRADAQLDPERLKREPTKQDQRQQERDKGGFDAIVAALRHHAPMRAAEIVSATGEGRERINRLLGIMCNDGRLIATQVEYRGNQTHEYRLADHLGRCE